MNYLVRGFLMGVMIGIIILLIKNLGYDRYRRPVGGHDNHHRAGTKYRQGFRGMHASPQNPEIRAASA